MKKQYFNTFEFNKFYSIKTTHPLEAKLIIEEYIKKYPKDYEAYTHYIDLLISIGESDEAEKILKKIEIISFKDGHFQSDPNRVKRLERRLIFNRIKLLSYQEKYEELYAYYLKNKYIIDYMDYRHVIYHCQKKLGLVKDSQRVQKSYLYRQIYEYSEEEFLEHVKTHSADYNANANDLKQGIFVPDFPIEKVAKEIKKYIPSQNRLCVGFLEDIYVFKYDGCGRDKNRLQDYFKVVCFHNTNNIITMYPSADSEYIPNVDLNYLVPKEKSKLIRRKSQIEKFNIKYGN